MTTIIPATVITTPGTHRCISNTSKSIDQQPTIITWDNCTDTPLPDIQIRIVFGTFTGSRLRIDQRQTGATFIPIATPAPEGFESPFNYLGANTFAITSETAEQLVLHSEVQHITYTINFKGITGTSGILVLSVSAETDQQVTGRGGANNTPPTQSPGLNSSLTIQPNSLKFNAKQTNIDDMVRVPSITITLQSDIYGNNLDEVAFNVYDTIAYCSNYPSGCNDNNNDRCVNTVANKRTRTCPITNVRSDQVIKTEYLKRLDDFNKVVKGMGCTLRKKAEDINDTSLDTDEFMLRISSFGMIKYVLAKMMTGQFNLKWLLNRNEKEFFAKLSRSRLCGFREVFNRPEIRGYGKYFK